MTTRSSTQPAAALRRATIVTVGAALIVLAVGAPASAGETGSAAPQLSIKVENGRTTTATGETLDYTVTVRNIGTSAATGLTITQTVPEGHTLASVDSAGTPGTSDIRWALDLATTNEATFHSTMTVSATSPELLRLATVACARASADGPPIVCASHSDQLPAGAAAEAARSAAAPDEGPTWVYLLGVISLAGITLAAAASAVVRRRTTRQRDAEW